MSPSVALAVVAALTLTGCGRSADRVPGALIVSAASSLTTVLEPLVQAFERDTGIAVELNLAASSTLAAQILAGAPVDVFISADRVQMDRVADDGLLRPDTRTDLLSNQLVVVTPREPPVPRAASPAVLQSFARIAIGDPASVPAGVYARAYLESVGLWDRVQDSLVPTHSVRAALVMVEAGDVDAAIVYRTDALSSGKVTLVFAVPVAEGPMIVYPAAVTAASSNPVAGERLLAYLSGPGASAAFVSAGFIMPKERR